MTPLKRRRSKIPADKVRAIELLAQQKMPLDRIAAALEVDRKTVRLVIRKAREREQAEGQSAPVT